MGTGIEIYDKEGNLVMSNEMRIMTRDYQKKKDIPTITKHWFHAMNPYLTNAKTKAITSYNGYNLKFYAFDSWDITDHGVVYLYQPKDQCSIAFTTGRFPTADAGQQGIMGVSDASKTGYVLPVRMTEKYSESSGILEVFNQQGEMTWNLQTLLDCPVVVDIIRIPLDYSVPFNQWDLKWTTPPNLNPDNIFFMSPNVDYWGWHEEGWQCSWMNFTRDGRDFWYVAGSTEPPQAFPNKPHLGKTLLKQVFNQDVLIFVFSVADAT